MLSKQERIDALFEAVAEKDLPTVRLLARQILQLPAKHNGVDVEKLLSAHFDCGIATLLFPLKRKWSFGGCVVDFLSKPPKTDLSAWADFVVAASSAPTRKAIYNTIFLQSNKTKSPDVVSALGQALYTQCPTDVQLWKQQALLKPSSRAHLFVSLVNAQNDGVWDAHNIEWGCEDICRIVTDISKGGLKLESASAVVFLEDKMAANSHWLLSQKLLKKSNQQFDRFYQKAFGRYPSTDAFLAAHDPMPWVQLSAAINPILDKLGWSWWQTVQACARREVKSVFGKDAPSKAPRSLHHALLLSQFAEADMVAGVGLEIQSPFDAYCFASSSPALIKRILKSNPSLLTWKDEYGNTMGHYIMSCTKSFNKSLINDLVRLAPQWFETTNVCGNTPASLAATHPSCTAELAAHISNTILSHAIGKTSHRKARGRKI